MAKKRFVTKRAVVENEPVYHAFLDGEHVATIAKTGTHLDPYPWDWYLEGKISGRKRDCASEQTKRDAIESVKWNLGYDHRTDEWE